MLLRLIEKKHTYKKSSIEVSVVDTKGTAISIYNWKNIEKPLAISKNFNTKLSPLEERKEITALLKEVELLEEDETIYFE